MTLLRHIGQLLKDLIGFARMHKAYWIVPLTVILLLVGLLLVTVSTISPFIYSLF